MSNDQPFGTVLSLVVGGAAGYAAGRWIVEPWLRGTSQSRWRLLAAGFVAGAGTVLCDFAALTVPAVAATAQSSTPVPGCASRGRVDAAAPLPRFFCRWLYEPRILAL